MWLSSCGRDHDSGEEDEDDDLTDNEDDDVYDGDNNESYDDRASVRTSTPAHPRRTESQASSLSRPSRTSSNLSGVVPGRTMRYRPFVDHNIKKMGLIKLAKRVGGILDMTVKKARSALAPSQRFSLCVCEKCQCKDVSFKERKVSINYLETLLDEKNGEVTELVCSCHPHLTSCPGLGNFEDRIWSEEFEKMGLPSFRPLYMFLCRVPLDIIHESLRLRLQHRPKGEPSSLSVRQVRKIQSSLLYVPHD